eukprot:CAMPEP_0113504196 /NCGR_PEP_ID=MMETSP0014_2-20120614/34586_1 /TAXON_ID=2857 /ORGANISM="Nitzschia sp." /LENGTH=515 /DNA_ID=CAMNT_0000399289 /DNA_START=26 /DNA_END=1573 /DNA_ORIENTATION=+ /assembly_acc=CAM_ASM_000159
MKARTSRPSRIAFKLVVLSLFTTNSATMGLVQSSSLRQPQHHHQQQQQLQQIMPSTKIVATPSLSPEAAAAIDATTPTTSRRSNTAPTLSREEETDLLRKAFEYRRISKLEKDLALSPKYSTKPLLLSIKAREAGYGDEFDLYEQAKFDGQKARETLVTRNMGLVYHCVNQIVGKDYGGGSSPSSKTGTRSSQYKKLPLNSLSREDLVQEGAIGLARAVDKWDPAIAVDGGERGNKFGTYAYYWIRAAVLRCIAERDDLMRVPSHVSQAVREINKAASRLGIDLEGSSGMISSLSWKEAQAAKKLAEEAGLTDKKFQEAMKVRSRRYSGGYVPFEQWMQKGQNIESDVADLTASAMTSSVLASDNAEHFRTVLSKYLRPKEIEALSWRYGLLKDEAQVNNETPAERANRQFAEMEDELFAGTSAPTTVSVLATATAAAAASTQKNTKKIATQQPPAVVTSPPMGATGKSGEAMSFVDVGKRMQVSAEYTRKLCHRALDKLRSAADEGRLEPAFLM